MFHCSTRNDFILQMLAAMDLPLPASHLSVRGEGSRLAPHPLPVNKTAHRQPSPGAHHLRVAVSIAVEGRGER